MSKKMSVFGDVIALIVTLIGAFLGVYVVNNTYEMSSTKILLFFLLGAIVAGFIITFFHELGHFICAKKNGFLVTEFKVWFLKWTLVSNKFKFSFCLIGEEAGKTETVPIKLDNLNKRLYRLTRGGIVATFILFILGIPSLFLAKYVSFYIYAFWVMFVPVGAYFFFESVMPITSGGLRNDGAVLCGLKKNDEISKVILSLLSIHAQTYQGLTPSEIDKKYYFDIPQLQEDSPYFLMVLNARYNYFVDIEDFENAKKTMDRLLSLESYFPKSFKNAIYGDALYSYCTFDFNEDKADDFSYEIEKYLNNVNSVSNIRIKLAYILYVKHETDFIEDFYNKGIKESFSCQIKGLGAFERKLLDRIKQDFPQ